MLVYKPLKILYNYLLLLVLWSLLRGRRPVLGMPRFTMPPGRQWGFPKAGARRTTSSDDVVDVETREVPDSTTRIDHRG